MAAIAGSIAEAYYGGVPNHIYDEVVKRLPQEMIDVMSEFYSKYIHNASWIHPMKRIHLWFRAENIYHDHMLILDLYLVNS